MDLGWSGVRAGDGGVNAASYIGLGLAILAMVLATTAHVQARRAAAELAAIVAAARVDAESCRVAVAIAEGAAIRASSAATAARFAASAPSPNVCFVCGLSGGHMQWCRYNPLRESDGIVFPASPSCP